MSDLDDPAPPPPLYDERWLYGPTADVVAARAALRLNPKALSFYPAPDEPPIRVDEEGTDAGFIVSFRRDDPPAWPPSLKRATVPVGLNVFGTL